MPDLHPYPIPPDKRSRPWRLVCPVARAWPRLLLLLSGMIPAIVAPALAHPDEVRLLGLNEGLSSRRVNAIIQDRRGKIWIGTDNGLNTFDGSRFQLFSGTPSGSLHLPSPFIRTLVEDEAENLWIITPEGAVALHPHRNKILPLSALGVPDSISRQPNFNVEPHPLGGFWMMAGEYLYRYRKTAKGYRIERLGQQPFTVDYPPKMVASARGQLWLFHEKTGLAVWDGKAFHIVDYTRLSYPGISPEDERFAPMPKSAVNTLGDSITFFFTDHRAVVSVDEASKTIHTIDKKGLDYTLAPWQSVLRYLAVHPEILGKNALRLEDIYKDRRGAWWFVSNMGIFLVNSGQKYPFKQIDFLHGQSIRGIFRDDQGDFLIGTYNGLYTFREGRQPTILTNPGVVWSILQIEKDLFWVGRESAESLAQYKRLSDGSFQIKMFPYGFVYDMTQVQNTLWIGGREPVLRYVDIASGRLLQEILLEAPPPYGRSPYVKKVLATGDSTIWAGGDAGFFMLRPSYNGSYRQDVQGIPKALQSLQINDLYEDARHHIWIASKTQGLIRFTPKTKEIKWYKEEDGLAHNITYSLLSSHSDSLLWVGTQKGLSCLQTYSDVFTSFYENDGLAHNEFNTAAAFKSMDGTLYFGGLNGVTYFRPELPSSAESPPAPYVIMEVLNLKSDRRRQIIPQQMDTITLQPLEQFIEIQLFSNEVQESERVKFRYFFPKLFDSWQNAKTGEKIIFTKLPPGYHNLRVQARAPDGSWGPHFTLHIRVLPPWYRTWWFYTLSILSALAVAYGLFRLRVAQIRREYDLRKQVSDDLHDDLGSRLYALRTMAHKMTIPLAGNPEMARLLEQFNNLSRDTLHTIRNFIWAFDPKNDRLEDLSSRMEDFADIVIRPLAPQLQFHTQNLPKDKKIRPLVKHHTLLAFQEILTNMTKHTRSRKISVTVESENRFLFVIIHNNFEHTDETTDISGGTGKESITARLRAIKGKMEWKETDGKQEAKLTIPV